jgi:hypothetical protein
LSIEARNDDFSIYEHRSLINISANGYAHCNLADFGDHKLIILTGFDTPILIRVLHRYLLNLQLRQADA